MLPWADPHRLTARPDDGPGPGRFRQNRPARVRAATLDQAMYHVPHMHDRQCRCVIGFGGSLDAVRLARAVELSVLAAPVLGCSFHARPWRSRWEPCPRGARGLFSCVRTEDPGPETASWLAEPIDALRGPPAAVRLIRSGNDTLCIKLDHMAADAGGLLHYVRLLQTLYDRLRSDPGCSPPASPANLRGLGRVLRGAGWRALLRGLRRFRFVKAGWGFPQIGSDLSGRAFPARTVEAARLARLKAWCRTRNHRFTDVLLTSCHRALSETLNPQTRALLPVEVTIDMRRYLPAGARQTVADLTGASFPAIRHVPGATFEQSLAAIESAVAGTHETWLGGAMVLEVLSILPTFLQSAVARSLLGQGFSGMVSPAFSNLGALGAEAFDFGEVRALDLGLYGPVMFPPHFVLTVYTFRDQLRINSSICPTAVDESLVDAVLDRFVAELPA